ncbi:MAG: hypothetical protein AUF79_10470 [Crenarchaeota archaeon 13_1_20CM_2_51_8]|nr:MAG: hypothetical protein AUF79_10470 [Crenarchaeota archaeon 13_1_20CM_2_51_8]
MVPRIRLEVSSLVNEFCHVSVLYSDCLPLELSSGMLGNKVYASRNSQLRQNNILREFQRAPISSRSWYSFARDLMRARDLKEMVSGWKGREPMTDVFLNILSQGSNGWAQIWDLARPRLEGYKQKFESEWNPISDSVLSRLSQLAKVEWMTDEIRVHFVDCLNGGFAWHDSIAFATLPDVEVQKKFLSHELSELITPSPLVEKELRRARLDPEIAHTVVDMLGYFSVKDFIAKPADPNMERKGVVPNKNYYPKVEELYTLFEEYTKNPSKYDDFSSLVKKIVLRLKTS